MNRNSEINKREPTIKLDSQQIKRKQKTTYRRNTRLRR